MTEHNEELLESVAEEIGQRVSPDIHGDLMGVEDAAEAILGLDFVATIRAQARREAFMDAQQIVAGDQMVDEARGRDGDRISVDRAIRELDAEIRGA